MEIIFWNPKVERFIDDLDDLTASHVRHCLRLLKEHGHLLDMPDSKSLGKGLFELRTQGKIKIRILYVFHNNKAYLIHCFIKKVWKIRTRDIDYAKKIQRELIKLA